MFIPQPISKQVVDIKLQNSQRHYWLSLLISGVFGALIAFVLLPAPMLLGLPSYWNRIGGDNAAGLIGYYALAHDQWRWPALATALINSPQGANAYFTDSVPIMALIGKALFKNTGLLYPYFGVWILLSYILMGVLACAILRYLGIGTILSILGAILIILTPEFLWRFQHIGLIAQFFILASLLLYFHITSASHKKETVVLVTSFGVMVFVNPYLFAMCSAVLLAGLLDACRLGRISLSTAVTSIFTLLSASALMAFAAGLLASGESLPASGGFGRYSMNLLSPIMPQYSVLSGPGFLDATGGQYEGFNYLGAGSMAVVIVGAIVGRKKLVCVLQKHLFLILIMVALTAYAASSKIYVGAFEVLDIPHERLPIIDRITSIFRSSGRFFWPVGFLIVIAAIVAIHRSWGAAGLGKVLVPALALQVLDLTPLYSLMNLKSQLRATNNAGHSIGEIIEQHDFVSFYPGYLCADKERETILELQLASALRGKPFDGAYLGRGDPGCSAKAMQLNRGLLADVPTNNPLLFVMKGAISPAVVAYADNVSCRDVGFAFLCERGTLSQKLSEIGTAIDVQSIPLSTKMRPNEDGSSFLGGGWSVPEGPFRWAVGSETRLLARMPHGVCNALEFRATIQPFSYGDHFVNSATVVLRGAGEQEIKLSSANQQQVSAVFRLHGCLDVLDFSLRFAEPKSPRDLGMSQDPREVTWGFYDFEFRSTP